MPIAINVPQDLGVLSRRWGGGLRQGIVVGASDGQGAYVAERPLSPEDIAATVYHHLGIDGRTTSFPDRAGRPLYLVENGEPIRELVG